MKKKYNIAVVGATGIVGETLLDLLQEREFPIASLFQLASERSAGEVVFFGDSEYAIETLDQFDFSDVDFAFFAAGSEVSARYVPIAAKAGCIAIDKSNVFRYEQDVPLVIPEVNPHALTNYQAKKIIANPNCTTIPILIAIKPILDFFGVTRMNVATYQSVSGVGKKGIEALATETADILNGQAIESPALSKQIAFNVLPKIDDFQDNGYTLEEMKLIWETKKILDDNDIAVNVTAVRVPVFFGHSAAIHLETKKPVSANVVRELLQKFPEIAVVDDQYDYPTPVTHAADQDAVFVGRIRKDISHPNGLNLWVTTDNVRKGAALNAIQIAETLIRV